MDDSTRACCHPVRYNWPDIMKLIAIWMVFMLHSHMAGELNMFLHDHSIAVFFFCSGFFVPKYLDLPLKQYAGHFFVRLMIPYFFFAAVSMITVWLAGPGIQSVSRMSVCVLLGMRDHLHSPALWFLPALFCTAVLYWMTVRLAHRLSPHPLVRGAWIFVFAAVSCCIAKTIQPVLHAIPLGHGSWALPWSADSALEYLPFYALGAWAFPHLKDFSFRNSFRTLPGLIFLLAGAAALVFTVLCFFRPELSMTGIPSYTQHPFAHGAIRIAYSFPVTLGVLFAALCLNRLTFPAKLGAQTLCCCGLELIFLLTLASVQTLFDFSVPGWNIRNTPDQIQNIPASALFAVFEILVIVFLFVPFFRKYFPFLSGFSVKKDGNA